MSIPQAFRRSPGFRLQTVPSRVLLLLRRQGVTRNFQLVFNFISYLLSDDGYSMQHLFLILSPICYLLRVFSCSVYYYEKIIQNVY